MSSIIFSLSEFPVMSPRDNHAFLMSIEIRLKSIILSIACIALFMFFKASFRELICLEFVIIVALLFMFLFVTNLYNFSLRLSIFSPLSQDTLITSFIPNLSTFAICFKSDLTIIQ